MMRKTKKFIFAIISLAVVAFLNASYLTFQAYSNWQSAVCNLSDTFSCGNVLSHPASWIFWIPFPAIAMIVYPVIIVLSWFSLQKKNFFLIPFISVISALWILFNSYIIYLEATEIRSYCLLCLICGLIILTIFVLSTALVNSKNSE